VHFRSELAGFAFDAHQVSGIFFAILRRMTQFGEIDIQVFFEIGVRQEFENFGAIEFSVALANWALQDMIVFSHCVFLSETVGVSWLPLGSAA